MKRLTALAIAIFASTAIATFGGQTVTSSTPAVSQPSGFFRPNEFETGAFGTFATGVGSSANSDSHAWGGGLDVTHWLPWKYGGIRFQGTGTNIR
jgi:muramoyltetrapeptide carboxypeptidase LdcA involved in peptidoglycan recycling